MVSFARLAVMLIASSLPCTLASPLLDDRAAKCNRDNLLRCFDPTGTKPTDVASRSAATAYCSSLLSIPVVTSIIATTTPVTTVASTVTTTDSTEISTSVSTSADVELTTTTTFARTYIYLKRDDAGTAVAPPACAAKATPLPSLVSACSCLSVTPSTTYITATDPTSTSVSLATVHETLTTTTGTTTTTTQVQASTLTRTQTVYVL
ncbi:hypothetical protein DL546_008394 [Coniochaeta pulveracea]|uniref:Uncharacterized protein n=1 Tax=Coniochaeta pulveracea TaxID=177199 RepID=A0A420YF25_9PEZI|nr:hypothetical protein DL546_008394 [Coniochaeta pulveracea]